MAVCMLLNVLISLVLFLAVAFSYVLIQLYRTHQELEIKSAISYFSSILYKHNNIDDLLWEVVRESISRLKLEDCVVYILDPGKENLVQKAALGPKAPDGEHTILNPIMIPLGQGIVGSAALYARTENVPDTTKDPRYILDDNFRYSEMAVPIHFNGEILGVIDSENSKKSFFTTKHQQILEAIASITAQKIRQFKDEQLLSEQQLIITQKNSSILEWKLQALQNQMDPHFILNAMNSLQSLILSNNIDKSIFYVSKFSKILHKIFKQSENPGISVAKEIEFVREYIQMEALRFTKQIDLSLIIDPMLNLDDINIPTFICQPIVENSIWHGFAKKTSDCVITITIQWDAEKKGVLFEIHDNGGGYKPNESPLGKMKSGRGMNLITQRLQIWGILNDTENWIRQNQSVESGYTVVLFFGLNMENDD
jgi:putative methionine-R-sulfoxide reductase with GAF domain/two-component sensor histidine kinase